jgi:hypothetical protein
LAIGNESQPIKKIVFKIDKNLINI